MRETTESNLCIALSSLLSPTSYYLKPDEEQAPEDLARQGVNAVRGIMTDSGQPVENGSPEDNGENDESGGGE